MSMKQNKLIFVIGIASCVLLILLNSCSTSASNQEPTNQASPTPKLSLTQRQNQMTATSKPNDANTEATPTPLLGEFLTDRTPEPTATLSPLMQTIETYAARRGLLNTKFLGITLFDWINLLISALIGLAGYFLGKWLINRVLPRLVKRTATQYDDEMLKKVGSELRWLVTIIALRIALTDRLGFISDRLNQALKDIFYVLTLSLVIWIIMKLINISADWYADKQAKAGRKDIEPVIKMVTKFIQILTGIIGVTILLSHFGVNVTSLTAALGIGGFAISLAAKDTVSDAIAGVIILFDQPFRVGDRIEIQSIGTWGDVTEIGLRTTRIRTRDNRMVIVPNAILSHNQVVNYSYPDPRYRIQTHVYIPFGEDVDQIRQLLINAVKQVEGVLSDKPVDALFIDMTEGPIKFRLRWWIESYVDTRRMFDRVHTTIKRALDEAGIQSPLSSSDINLLIDPLTTENISRAFQSSPSIAETPSQSDYRETPDRNVEPGSDE